jgi:sulfate permease, SulP family
MHNTALFATALRETLRSGYTWQQFRGDLSAGLTVGVVAIPLSMALAIAVGAPPQHGLYTAIVAGIIIALFGGSRVNISGPTAAFVVILLPITHQYGLGGLLIATVMAGIMLLIMGLTRMGRFIEYIPYPVTTGFTAGIGVVIATLQLKDFLGLETGVLDGHYLHKLGMLLAALPTTHLPDVMIGVLTLGVLLLWPRLKTAIPGPLIGLLIAALAAWLGRWYLGDNFDVATIGSEFSYHYQGETGAGIPPILPSFVLPWNLPGADGEPVGLSFDMLRTLIGSAFAIAMLGAIESLLCAVVADGMTGKRHNPNAELVGQGLGNIIAPFFGGISATAAIARTATNIRSGAVSPLAAVIHSLLILAVILSLSPLLAYVPMAALAALLLIVAWNMSETPHFIRLIRISPGSDVVVLLTCFSLTVLFDMVIAVSAGLVLAALLFIRRMAELTGTELVDHRQHAHLEHLPDYITIYDINGPLFFGAAEKAMRTLRVVNGQVQVMILDMRDVSMVDITGIMALNSLLCSLNRDGIVVIINALEPRLILRLRRAGIRKRENKLLFSRNLDEALKKAMPFGAPAVSDLTVT